MGVYKLSESGGLVSSRRMYSSMLSGNPSSVSGIEYLVIAGGGGGGNGAGGGGGAGGYRSSVTGELSGANSTAESLLIVGTSIILGTNYSVSVGAGGAGRPSPDANGFKGVNSSFASITSEGGGFGSGWQLGNGGSGGSGGGSATGSGGAGTANQGFAGAGNQGGGGGASEGGNTDGPGTGGDGLSSSITGSAITRAGGGASGGAAAGDGGGGSSSSSVNGVSNTGGGGGGNNGGPASGNGGSGVVILRYPSSLTITVGAGLTASTSTVGSKKVTTITAGTGNVSWAA